MERGPYEKVPLAEDEKDLLLSIYDTRLRFFMAVYVALIAMAIFIVVNPFRGYLREMSLFKILGTVLLLNVVPFVAIIGTGIRILTRRILPFKHDALSGMKEKVPFRVIRQELDITGQYYVALDDPDYLHHELDEDTYYRCNVGDLIYLYRGARSGYIFEPDSRYSII